MTLFETGGTLVLGGLPDAGKTYAMLELATAQLDPRKSIILSLEYPRTKECYDIYFSGKPVNIVNCTILHDKTTKDHKRGSINTTATYDKFKHELDLILDNLDKYYIIGIDGVSKIRRYGIDKWLEQWNKDHPSKPKAKIGKDNLTAWAEVNADSIADVIEPLQNLSLQYNNIIVYTVEMKPIYNTKDEKIGLEPDIHTQIGHIVSVICELQQSQGKYYVQILRSIRGATGLKQYSELSPAPEYKKTGVPLWELLMNAKI